MASHDTDDTGPDLSQGVTLADFGGQPLLRGHVGDDAVLLARIGDELLAVGANCTHYGGPLAQGLIDGDTVRCPWHHACFSLRSGEALGAPAFDALPCWRVKRAGQRIVVRERLPDAPAAAPLTAAPQRIVIVGGGAAGFACAEMLRRRGFDGQLTMLSDDADAPCDRPNLSKDYLAGTAPEEWIPLRPEGFYAEQRIDLLLSTRVARIDIKARQVLTADGKEFGFDRLLLATGAEPVRLPIPGAEQPQVMTLRTLADSRAIVERAKTAKSAVVLGSGFIGLETAAALRTRGLQVHVVSLDRQPLDKVLGVELGGVIRALHESHGVVFHMGTSLANIAAQQVTLSDGSELAADLVILGVGVRPRTALAEAAGLAVERGILVDETLQTSVPGIYAAGDVARWRDAGSGATRRVEHWVVAERQGQVAAQNMLGAPQRFDDVPFFWSAHYDLNIRYAGYAPEWDTVQVAGDLGAHDALLSYWKDGRRVAVAAIGRDLQALQAAQALGAAAVAQA
jgi:NADPH-dependent 2,4-dienoyl-CoA reductase/sulfur reductase-like enzyme/nitrite reductase/ring-hydroxylating ferredoxin subunit